MAENDSPLGVQGVVKRSSRFPWTVGVLVVLLIVIAAGAYAWYALPGTCPVSAVDEASAILVSLVKRYDDVYQSATAASPTSVVVPVAVLQQILMDTQQVAVPVCMRTAKTELINYMDTVIRAFRAYSAQEANTTVRDLIVQSETHYANFSMELKAVKKCAPYCIR